MPIELPWSFQNLNTSSLPNATDSNGDVTGKSVPASYFDENFQKLANAINIQSSEPSNPFTGMFWFDTSVNPPILKQYNGTEWISVTTQLPSWIYLYVYQNISGGL